MMEEEQLKEQVKKIREELEILMTKSLDKRVAYYLFKAQCKLTELLISDL